MSENDALLNKLVRMTDRSKDKFVPPRAIRPFFRNQDQINELLAQSLHALNENLQAETKALHEKLQAIAVLIPPLDERIQNAESRLDRLERNVNVLQAATRNSDVNVADFHQLVANEKAGLEQERVIVSELRAALGALLREDVSGQNGSSVASP